jgi:zinc/manganese transport system permease protein
MSSVYSQLIGPFADAVFMRHALAALVTLSFGSAPIGVFLMLRRMSLTGDALSHAILPGVAAAFLLSGLNIFAMAAGGLVAGLIVAALTGLIARSTDMKEDASLAIVYLVSLALGVIIVSARGTSVDLMDILFGDIRKLDADALLLIAVSTTVALLVLAVIYRPLVIECVDPVFLRVTGRAGGIAHFAFLALVVLNLVSAYRALGTLLAVGLMILPAGIARFWSRDMTGIIVVAVFSALLSGYLGLLLSFHADLPTGPAVILVAGLFYVASLLLGPAGGLLRSRIRHRTAKA